VKDSEKVRELIQVCQDPSRHETNERECRALIKASKDVGCKNLIVITEDYEGIRDFEWWGTKRKIKFVPLWKWLLEK
jgi:predicted AAA+ superfamily ATPase